MEIAFLIGRIIAGLYYTSAGLKHFQQLDMMAGYARSKGVPAPKLAIAGSGLLIIIGGLDILLGYRPVIGVIAIVLFLLPVTFTIHNFWSVQDPQQKMAEMVNFTKNLGLIGSALMFLAIPQPWPYSIGG